MAYADMTATAVAGEAAEVGSPGRPAAGENPAKRDQILDGAKSVFATQGFEGASMNDITRAAGVSKGTIYVYFDSKEDLFAGLIERERERMFNSVQSILDETQPLETVLYNFGIMFANHMTSANTVHGMRMVLGVLDVMPAVAQRFLNCGPTRGAHVLKDYIANRAANGELKLDDPLLAARQFADLCLVGLFKPALFGEITGPLPEEEVRYVVNSAIRMFMKNYAA
jgi:AcrR family transcriptional regulator